MPSNLRQLMIRLTEADEAVNAELLAEAKERTGLPLSQSDLYRLALRALKREYDADPRPKPGRKGK